MQPWWNTVGLIILTSLVGAFWAWFWRHRTRTVQRLEDEKKAAIERANRLEADHKELVGEFTKMKTQMELINQTVTPINQMMQTLLIRQLTHARTPEIDGLMAKLPPTGNLTPQEQERLAVLLKERAEELNGSISPLERGAAIILPYMIDRVKAEMEEIANAAMTASQLKIVAVPAEIADDTESPKDAVDGKKQDEGKGGAC